MIERIRKLSISGPGIDRVFELPEGSTLIGRQEGVDLLLPDKLISRQHALIECQGEQCQITDLKSSNGTRINGQTIQPNSPSALENGTLIEIGPYRLVFELLEIEIPIDEGMPERETPPVEPGAISEDAAGIGDRPSEKETHQAEPESIGLKSPITPIETDRTGETRPQIELIPADSFEPPPGLQIHSQRLISYLPGIFQNDFMQRFMGIFESILTPVEWTIDNFDLFLNPSTAPYGFLPWLANWFVLTFDSTWNETQRRQLMVEAHKIYARRGTPWALKRVLEIYTGAPPLIDDQSPDLEAHTFSVTLPVSSELVNVELVKALINANKPAHTNYSLHFAGGG